MDDADRKVIGRIKEIMREQQLNQIMLSEKTGVIRSSISAILSGIRSNRPLVDAMAEKMGVNKDWLLIGSGFKYTNSQKVANVAESSHLDINERNTIMKELNALYARHQNLLEEASGIMKTIVELNKKILLNENFNV